MNWTEEEFAEAMRTLPERRKSIPPGQFDKAWSSLTGDAPTSKPKRQQYKPGHMNKTEAAYADLLETRRIAGEIFGYRFEAVRLKLAPDTTYTPDFLVWGVDIEFHEVKACTKDGQMRFTDDGRVKLKLAAELFPMFNFVAAGRMRLGGWKFEAMPCSETAAKEAGKL